MHFLIKVLISALIIVLVSEIGKRSTTTAAIVASLPLTSILALIWLYLDTKDVQKISDLSISIFWVVLPSLVFFISLPLLLKSGVKFVYSLPLACLITFLGYSGYMWILTKIGVKI